MRIGVIGINHKTAEVCLREQFAKTCQERLSFDGHFSKQAGYVLLSTCNRTEIYFSSADLPATHSHLLYLLRLDIREEFEHKIYSYFGADCFLHLAGVTAGLDSAILGETEIQGQVKQAYEWATLTQTLSSPLHFLFQKSLKIGKDIRSSISDLKLPTLTDTVIFSAEQVIGSLDHKKILLVGLSEINRKLIKAFKQRDLFSLSLCNRTQEKGKLWAEQEGISFLPWECLNQWITFDLIIFGTKAPGYLIRKEKAGDLHSPQLILDLSVPRNVDPSLATQASLLNIDQLHHLLDTQQSQFFKEKMRSALEMVTRAVDRQLEIFLLKEHKQFRTPLLI